MFGGRSQYALPVTLYHLIVGCAGLLFLLWYTYIAGPVQQSLPLLPLLLFFSMQVVASFLHFQYARLNVVITFESSFIIATLLVFGSLPAVWLSVVGVLIGSVHRAIHRRFVLHKRAPLHYEIGILAFNSGMMAILWLFAGWIYFVAFQGDFPLTNIHINNIVAILLMYLAMGIVNHLILMVSSYLQGMNVLTVVRNAMLPAFLTEFVAVPFGVVIALSYTRLGIFPFFYLASTLLLSNAVLRRLSLIRYALEEKLRQLTTLNTISRQVISKRDEEGVGKLLLQELGKIIEGVHWFVARADDKTKHLHFLGEGNQPPAVVQLVRQVSNVGQPMLLQNVRKEAPPKLRDPLLQSGIRSCILVPMMASEKIYGVLGAYSQKIETFKDEDTHVLTMIADEAALALENSSLYGALTDKISELLRLNKDLQKLDRLKSDFLANVSHELRTPLTSIKGYVEYIRKEKLGPITTSQSEGLTVAHRNIIRLQQMINDLLDYTRLEFKRTPIQVTVCSLEEIWNRVYDQHADSIARNRQMVHVTIPPDLPCLFLDESKFTQVLSNLVSNAIKFTPEQGSIWIEARTVHHASRYYDFATYADRCMLEALEPVEIIIKDNGVGIPKDALPKIFERFYQVDSSNTRRYAGTGLGLALVKSILKAHGSPIEVESTVGVGTVFAVVVPGIQAANVSTAVKSPLLENGNRPKYLT